jgi:hypothetical protein
MNKDIDTLKVKLQEGTVSIKFTKVDGTIREMNCTKSNTIIPAEVLSGLKNTKAPRDDVMSVWDVDKDQWRSFRIDNIIEWT